MSNQRPLIPILIVILLIISLNMGVSVFAESPSFALIAAPQLLIPVGSKAEYYQPGIGGKLEGLLALPLLPNFTAGIDLVYTYVPLTPLTPSSENSSLSLLSLGPGLRAALPLGQSLSIWSQGHLSLFFGSLQGTGSDSAWGLSWGIGGGFSFILSRRLMLNLSASFESYSGLYNGIAITLGLTTRISGPGSKIIPKADFIRIRPDTIPEGLIELVDIDITRVFPVLYKYYDTHSIGTASVVNGGEQVLENLEITFDLPQYSDAPKLCAQIDRLEPGGSTDVDIYVLFNDSVLGITEGTIVSAILKMNYTIEGHKLEDMTTVSLEIHDRNALRWDDDRKIAAFVTARDEEIQRFSRNVASIVRNEGLSGFDRDFQLAIALLGSMEAQGCTYVVDPSSSYLELSQDSSAVDTVLFPKQTMEYLGGDCDDLSVTYAAMLESVGIESGFITVPGHIFTAFKLDMNLSKVRRTFSRSDDFIIRSDGSVWLPVETTALRKGFIEAWASGARQWRKHFQDGRASLFPTREAWSSYSPVAFSVSTRELEFPHKDAITEAFVTELEDFVNQEISIRENLLQKTLSVNPDDNCCRNRLGILYAQYGQTERASVEFKQAASQSYSPALVNLGNIAFLQPDYISAESYYKKALNISPNQLSAIIGLARIMHAKEDYDGARVYHQRLSDLSPSMANRYAWLSESGDNQSRAALITDIEESITWDDE